MIFLFYWIMGSIFGLSSTVEAEAYISQYQHIAITEMSRTGIPASIKLAQALLESNKGQSDIAKYSNNHFGIKCGSKWNGVGIYMEDDDYDSNGDLTKSCFRVYDTPEESFTAHSDFLYKPHKESRYDFLFEFANDDYHSWAYGLKRAGYATDEAYPDKLIQIIDKYKLYTYDQLEKQMSQAGSEEVAITEEVEETPIPQDTIIDVSAMFAEALRKRQADNHVVTSGRILDKHDPAPNDNNVTIVPPNRAIKTEPEVKVTKTKRVVTRHKGQHLVKDGEDMYSISRRYRVSLETLYSYNRLPEGSQPLTGEVLKVDGYIHWGKRPKFHKPHEKNTEVEYLFEGDPSN